MSYFHNNNDKFISFSNDTKKNHSDSRRKVWFLKKLKYIYCEAEPSKLDHL